MILSGNRYIEIKEITLEVFNDYGIHSFPVNVFLLARKMNIIVEAYSNFPISSQNVIISASDDGMSFYSNVDKHYHILYKDNGNQKRIRFTIAHELGHIVLGHEKSTRKTEREADFFAGQLLIPEVVLVRYRITDWQKIMKMFDVSSDCACNSLNSLATRFENFGWTIFEYEKPILTQFGIALKGE